MEISAVGQQIFQEDTKGNLLYISIINEEMNVVESVCSTCLKGNNSKLTNVTDLDYDGISLLDKLRACVSAELEVDSNNMIQMCQSCMDTLKLSYTFRELVLESLQTLKCFEENVYLDSDSVKSGLEDIKPRILIVKDEVSNNIESKDEINEIIEQMREEAIKQEELSCKECSLTFKRRNVLQQHFIKIHNKSSFICVFCGNSFKTSFHLKEHITSHTGEKNYNCTHCEKAFPRLSSLKRHLKTHYAPPGQKTKKTPFLCTICGKNFPFSNGAARHMRTHFGVKTHECQICNKKFNQSTHLHVHMRTHSGEKPYICENCGERFTLKAGLHKHLRTRHNVEESESSQWSKSDVNISEKVLTVLS
ncbi:hypothetical protein HHI36_005422 [Cryptolaemus montrouzieri]|uniref:Zinc finger protein n=1 Tax=Cryptolaemus montrouzieri TaxID=559131 RepID=A0ABD2NU40_9CUCU